MRLDSRLIAPAVALSLLGCIRIPIDPLPESFHLTLALSSPSGDPSHPITLVGRLTNVGRQPITYAAPRGSGGIRLAVWNPDRSNVVDVFEECLNVACLRCPSVIVELQPRQSVVQEVVFNGTLVTCEGPYQGPSGVYSVEATFQLQSPDGASTAITRTATFEWTTAAMP
jgi:hypothetical protein